MEKETDQEEWDRKNKARIEEARERQERMGVPRNLRENMEQNQQESQVSDEQTS